MSEQSKRIYLSVPHMSGRERIYVDRAFDENWVSTVGPNLDEFEDQLQGRMGQPCVALSSGTAAIHLGLMALGVSDGDEVVCPTLTFGASCFPIVYLGARPVFLDSERESWNLDPSALDDFLRLRARQGKLPRAVIVVHLFGQSAKIGVILDICQRHGVRVLEDAAEALGSVFESKQPGCFGDVGVFSLNGNKMITSSGGGFVTSKDPKLVNTIRHWSTQARDADPDQIGNSYHSSLGFNYRMSNVLAGIALGQLEVLDERVSQRRRVFEQYKLAFRGYPGLEPQPELKGSLHSRWLSCFLVNESSFGSTRDNIIRNLASRNIESRPVWRPMHFQKVFHGYHYFGGTVSEDLHLRGICLPSSSSLVPEQQAQVIDGVVETAHDISS